MSHLHQRLQIALGQPALPSERYADTQRNFTHELPHPGNEAKKVATYLVSFEVISPSRVVEMSVKLLLEIIQVDAV